jgi:hypothetical protein
LTASHETILKAIQSEIEEQINTYKAKWDVALCDSTDIEVYGQNEFFGGKLEGFEESLEIIQKHLMGNRL